MRCIVGGRTAARASLLGHDRAYLNPRQNCRLPVHRERPQCPLTGHRHPRVRCAVHERLLFLLRRRLTAPFGLLAATARICDRPFLLRALSRLAAAQRVKFETRSGSGHCQVGVLFQLSSGWPALRTFGNREQSLDEVGLNVRIEPKPPVNKSCGLRRYGRKADIHSKSKTAIVIL